MEPARKARLKSTEKIGGNAKRSKTKSQTFEPGSGHEERIGKIPEGGGPPSS